MLLPALLLQILAGGLASEIITIILIFVVLFVIFKLGKMLFGIIINSVLGLISIFLLNLWFGLGITLSILVIIFVAIFGLPAVAVLVILRLLGIAV